MEDKERGGCPYPGDPEPYLEKLAELLPFFSVEDIMKGYLAMLVSAENSRQKDYIYTMEYYGGKWLWVKRRGYVYGYDRRADVVSRDTDADSMESLAGALASMRAAWRAV